MHLFCNQLIASMRVARLSLYIFVIFLFSCLRQLTNTQYTKPPRNDEYRKKEACKKTDKRRVKN